jgi:DNA-binding CsgD family transcriptional regulator
MSSRAPKNRCHPLTGLARTGDGGDRLNGVSNPMPKARSTPPPDGDDAIGLLSSELGLTPRQAEVLHWIAKGKTNEEISKILDCSFHTVKTHIREIFQRLEVPNRAGAIAAAYSMFYSLLQANRASAVRAIPKSKNSDRVGRSGRNNLAPHE